MRTLGFAKAAENENEEQEGEHRGFSFQDETVRAERTICRCAFD